VSTPRNIPYEISMSTLDIAEEIVKAREKAHAKHGDNSIEAISGSDPRWVGILGEEGGEVAEAVLDNFRQSVLAKAIGRVNHSSTYDAEPGHLRDELVDVASVAVAWIAALDWERWIATLNQPQ
jgi:hypothetical protein